MHVNHINNIFKPPSSHSTPPPSAGSSTRRAHTPLDIKPSRRNNTRTNLNRQISKPAQNIKIMRRKPTQQQLSSLNTIPTHRIKTTILKIILKHLPTQFLDSHSVFPTLTIQHHQSPQPHIYANQHPHHRTHNQNHNHHTHIQEPHKEPHQHQRQHNPYKTPDHLQHQ